MHTHARTTSAETPPETTAAPRTWRLRLVWHTHCRRLQWHSRSAATQLNNARTRSLAATLTLGKAATLTRYSLKRAASGSSSSGGGCSGHDFAVIVAAAMTALQLHAHISMTRSNTHKRTHLCMCMRAHEMTCPRACALMRIRCRQSARGHSSRERLDKAAAAAAAATSFRQFG